MLSDDDFTKLLTFLDRPWAGYRKVRKGVKKRVRRHMAALGCTDIDAYLNIIRHDNVERRSCDAALIVTISRFFRDRGLWQALKEEILPDLIRRFCAPIRIWSAGCANGEEAYSLALTWQMLAVPTPIEILATDINAASLARARTGVYRQSSLKEVGEDLLSRFFCPHHRRQFIIDTGRLAPIDWRQHDLLTKPPSGPLHMILLRNNLLTYHQGAVLGSALKQILSELATGGCLVVGSHEHPYGTEGQLVREPTCPWVYRKK